MTSEKNSLNGDKDTLHWHGSLSDATVFFQQLKRNTLERDLTTVFPLKSRWIITMASTAPRTSVIRINRSINKTFENASIREKNTHTVRKWSITKSLNIPMLHLTHHYLKGLPICSKKDNLRIMTVNQEVINRRKSVKCQLFVLAAGRSESRLTRDCGFLIRTHTSA